METGYRLHWARTTFEFLDSKAGKGVDEDADINTVKNNALELKTCLELQYSYFSYTR